MSVSVCACSLRLFGAIYMDRSDEGFRAPEVLAAALDLAVVYLKNYALDKAEQKMLNKHLQLDLAQADALYEATKPHCLSRGLPWNVKWFQDCATLRRPS